MCYTKVYLTKSLSGSRGAVASLGSANRGAIFAPLFEAIYIGDERQPTIRTLPGAESLGTRPCLVPG